jgi:hypothetical protein
LEITMANLITVDPLGEIARFDPFRDFENLFGTRRLRSLLRDLPQEPGHQDGRERERRGV